MGKRKKGDYEMLLEGRHLLGIFFAVVFLCALFFTLGFVLGRNQESSQAATRPPGQKSAFPVEEARPVAKDLSFYDRVDAQPRKEPLTRQQPTRPAKRTQPKPPPAAPSSPARPDQPIYLQVAAVSHEQDAKRLSLELEKLRFPVVIRAPREDRFYKVQVGPFLNARLAEAAQRRLQAQGFRHILRR